MFITEEVEHLDAALCYIRYLYKREHWFPQNGNIVVVFNFLIIFFKFTYLIRFFIFFIKKCSS